MFPINNIRGHVTNKLSEITVLREFRNNSGVLRIFETESNSDEDRKPSIGKELLNEVTISSIPLNNVWIFENEFSTQQFSNDIIKSQGGAFTSHGKKVEKTIIFHNGGKLYLFMIEMKREISPRKMHEDVIRKFEQSLSTLAVFISAHYDFPEFIDSTIYPVGICCYNYYNDPQPNYNRDVNRTAGRVRKMYEEGNRMIPLSIEPLGLNKMMSPILFYENPNREPVTKIFNVDLCDVMIKLGHTF